MRNIKFMHNNTITDRLIKMQLRFLHAAGILDNNNYF